MFDLSQLPPEPGEITEIVFNPEDAMLIAERLGNVSMEEAISFAIRCTADHIRDGTLRFVAPTPIRPSLN